MSDRTDAFAPDAPREIAREIALARLSAIYRLAPQPQAGAAVFSLIVAYAMWGRIADAWVLGWLVVRLLVSGARALDTRFFERDARRADRLPYWQRRFELLVTLDNLVWGGISLVFIPAVRGTTLGELLFASIMCITALGVFLLVSNMRTAVLNYTVMLLPLILQAAWERYDDAWIMVAALLVYGAVLTQESWRSYQRWTEMMRLRLEAASVAAERERARRAAVEASLAKSRFLANMSHEIRTPLNGILGMAELLQGTTLDAEQQRFARTISSAANTLHELLGDILDVSKIEEGKVTIERVDFDPVSLLSGTASIYAELGAARGTQVHTRLELDALPPVSGDPVRFRQVVTNLLGNALKFTEAGTVTLHATCRPAPTDDGRTWVRVSVTDTGIGMTPEQIGQLFQRFGQADSSTTRRFGGSGLGLVICKHLVELMGGHIDVTSTPNAGSTFWFEVPLLPALSASVEVAPASARISGMPVPPSPAANAGAPAPTPTSAPSGARILVAEDNAMNQLVVRAMLERLGTSVTLVEDGAQAVAANHATAFDLVLMDCQMPVMDGFEATRRIRASGGAHADVPIIALTANVLAEDRMRCEEAGMSGYLAKPVTGQALAEVLSRYVRPRSAA